MQPKKIFFFVAFFALVMGNRQVYAQQDKGGDLLKLLDDSLKQQEAQPEAVTSIFKATQVINLPTVEQPGKNNLQFIIMHRFGKLNGGAYELFGLDNATIRFGLDYGLTDRLAIGVGRSSLDKTFDASLKYKLLQQRTNGLPFALSLNGWITNKTVKYPDKPYMNARYRTSYTTQILLARKFSKRLSFEVVPTWVHYNLVPTPEDQNDILVVGLGGRMKITNRISVNAEYDLLPGSPLPSQNIKPSFGLGVDLETGGHVFQLVFSNSQGIVGPSYLTQTEGTWGNGDIYFGFNISRAFGWNKHKKK